MEAFEVPLGSVYDAALKSQPQIRAQECASAVLSWRSHRKANLLPSLSLGGIGTNYSDLDQRALGLKQ
jgi:hypothetical protein